MSLKYFEAKIHVNLSRAHVEYLLLLISSGISRLIVKGELHLTWSCLAQCNRAWMKPDYSEKVLDVPSINYTMRFKSFDHCFCYLNSFVMVQSTL